MMLLCYYVIVCGRFDRGRVWPGEKGLCFDFLRQLVDPTSISHFSDSYLSTDVCYVSNM